MIFVVDNYDSFTYNLVQYVGQCGEDVEVRRNDAIDVEDIARLRPAGIILSPGPGVPGDTCVCLDVLNAALSGSHGGFFARTPIFGVCLGHQAIAHVAGGQVRRAERIMHGKGSKIRHDGRGLFAGMPQPFFAIRYHSLIVTEASLPSGFAATAWAEDDGEVMGLRHDTLPIEGLQFHPESALTEGGLRIIENFVARVRSGVL